MVPDNYGSYSLSTQAGSCGAYLDPDKVGVCSAGKDEYQSIITSADGVMSGTFVLRYRGESSAPISFSATEEVFASSWRAIAGIPTVVSVARFVWDVHFEVAVTH